MDCTLFIPQDAIPVIALDQDRFASGQLAKSGDKLPGIDF
jgi:hypothetical protein